MELLLCKQLNFKPPIDGFEFEQLATKVFHSQNLVINYGAIEL